MEAQNLETGVRCGIWAMPPTLLGGGCAVEGSESVLILVHNHKTDVQEHIGMHAVSVMQAELPGAAKKCGLRAGTQHEGKTKKELLWRSPLFKARNSTAVKA